MRLLIFLRLALLGSALSCLPAAADCVLLIHGLARTGDSMNSMAAALTQANFEVHTINYPSIEALATPAIAPAIGHCEQQPIHFVTHSMGGVLVREYFSTLEQPLPNIGRVVMLGPPNQGSEVVDTFENLKAFEWINGPAGLQLGTEGKPAQLGAVNFELGVIAGNRSLNPLLSSILPGPDDGKVTVASTHVAGEQDHIVLPVTHTFMMNNDRVQQAVIHFLQQGRFNAETPHP